MTESEAISHGSADTLSTIEAGDSGSRLRRLGVWASKIVGGTILVCATATPFVSMWADKLSEKVEPVTGSLNDVSRRTEDLRLTVDEGIPQIAEPLNGVDDNLEVITSAQPNTDATTSTTTSTTTP